MPDNIVVRVSRKLPGVIEARMAELFTCHFNPDDRAMSEDELAAAMADCDVFVPTVTDRISRKLIEAAPKRLRMLANFGVGVDHIDVAAARACGIVVSNTPNVLTEDTADTAIALILAVSRRLNEGERLLRSHQWSGWSPTGLLGRRIGGKVLGIVGMGRIGTAIARRARAFGMTVCYHNRSPAAQDIAEALEATYYDDLERMVAEVDILSLNCPYTTATHHLLAEKHFKLMKADAILINTSRGKIVDERALVQALQEREIAGAGLDVFSREPQLDPALLDMPRVVLLPHISSATLEGRIDMGQRVIINIKTFQDRHSPPDRVLEPLL